MEDRLTFLIPAALGLTLVVAPAATDEPGHRAVAMHDGTVARCVRPRVTYLKPRRGGANGRRVVVRVGAETTRGRIGALYAAWGERGITIYDLIPHRRVSIDIDHTYRRAGRYRISVIAESAPPGCRLQKSARATRRVRVPVP